MSEKIIELRKDLAELNLLEAQASRQKVKDLFLLESRKISTEIVKLQEQLSLNPIPASVAPASGSTKRYQIKLNNYAWDQSSKFVKFYVTVPKVQSILPDNVSCTFTNKSLELTVKDLENKDYVFVINNLLHPINPEGGNWKIKTDMVLVNAAKVRDTDWTHVTELDKKVSDAKTQKMKPSDNADPGDGLMSLMKNMYDQGDDEMKRTIAKAWSESQNKPSLP